MRDKNRKNQNLANSNRGALLPGNHEQIVQDYMFTYSNCC